MTVKQTTVLNQILLFQAWSADQLINFTLKNQNHQLVHDEKSFTWLEPRKISLTFVYNCLKIKIFSTGYIILESLHSSRVLTHVSLSLSKQKTAFHTSNRCILFLDFLWFCLLSLWQNLAFDQFYFNVHPSLLNSTVALNINIYGSTSEIESDHTQLLTEFISHSSLEEFLLLESGNAIDLLKKWESEGEEDTQKRIRTIHKLKTLCRITKIRILTDSFGHHIY